MGIGEIWWEESHDWCVTLQGSGPGTGRAGEARCEGGQRCAELAIAYDVVESLWIRTKEQANKPHVMAGVFCRPASQNDGTKKLYAKELKDTAWSSSLVLTGNQLAQC